MFKDLPYPQPDRLVAVWPGAKFNNAMVRDAVASMPALEGASGVSGWRLTLVGEGEPLEVDAQRVSPDHFRVLGVAPALGRDFTAEEGLPDRGDVVILSHALWVRVFGADDAVIGRTLQLSGADTETHTVIGVMPPDFRPVRGDPEAWIPASLDPTASITSDDSWYVNHRVARLAPGATLEQADEQVERFARSVLTRTDGVFDEEQVREARVQPLGGYLAGDMGPVLWAALAAVSLVLLIACANVANLLLARGEGRAHDLAVRTALGAGRARVVRMLLAEGGILGVLGGGLGILLSFALIRLVVALAPADFPRIDEVAVDGSVLGYAVAVTALATLLAGLVPALRVSRVDATASLGGASRASSARRGSRLTTALVGAEVALAVVVTVGSGLMVRSLLRLTSVDLGLDPANLLVLRPTPPGGRYAMDEEHQGYYARVLARVGALPGVASVGAIHLLPGTMDSWNFPTWPEGVDLPEGTPVPLVNFRIVSEGYFETVGLRPMRGRLLTDADRADAERVMVVNEAFVERFWQGLDPVGRAIRTPSSTAEPYRVVGVVGDVRQHGLAREPEPEMYLTRAQWGRSTSLWLVARTRGGGSPSDHAAAIHQAVWSVDPDVPISGTEELARVFDRSAATTRFLTLVLGSFGVLALLLGAIGVFGVTAYAVARRIPEFGVRLALGSSRSGVLASALLTCAAPVGVGLLVGTVGAALSSSALRSVLFGVEPSDPVTFALVGGMLLAVALLASLVPAWRASRVDPVRVLSAD
jgi:predicted permease